MILQETISKRNIEEISLYYKKQGIIADVQLIEKVIYAFYLLELFSKTNIDFIFKGGTSLLLLLNKINRFSIDIDIVINKPINNLEDIFINMLKENKTFIRFKEDERKSKINVPKRHFKFYFNSLIDDKEKYIIMDILFEKSAYINLTKKEIKSLFLKTGAPLVNVKIPSIDDILGDKLTAFAPNTTGIPYGIGKELEIIKQLYDISKLFEEIINIEVVLSVFNKICISKLNYRGKKDIKEENVLEDIYNTCIIIACRGLIYEDNFNKLKIGIKNIANHILSEKFTLNEAILCASKVAYLSMLLKNRIKKIDYYSNDININELVINNDNLIKYLKGLKKIKPEAYYYFYKAIELHK